MTKKFLLPVLALLVILGAGCERLVQNNQLDTNVSLTNKTQDRSMDGDFEKKQQCAKYLQKYIDKWNSESNGQDENEGMYLRPTICYDRNSQSCVSVEHRINPGTDTVSLDITNVLTNESILLKYMKISSGEGSATDVDALIRQTVSCL